MNNAKLTKLFSLAFGTFALIFVSGISSDVSAQSGRDPFQQNPVYKKKDAPSRSVSSSGGSGSASVKPVKRGPYVVTAPSAEARINYFRQVREQAALSGQPIPKPTSVMLLDELSVMGIFRTPRGYAAIVKVTPIELSYTIYPGEKFFDGQLVAVEENRLVFRKVTKWSTGKFVSSVENKTLRKYSDQQTIQGTAPADAYSDRADSARNSPDNNEGEEGPGADVIVSPLDEMNQKANEAESESAKGKSNKKSTSSKKKRSKVAKKN